MKNLLIRFSCIVFLISVNSCSKDEILKRGCIKAEYISISDSYCGGPDKIKILKGIKHINNLFPGMKADNGYILTTNVPQNLKKTGTVFYFTAAAAEPKICTANVMWYTEIHINNVSESGCL